MAWYIVDFKLIPQKLSQPFLLLWSLDGLVSQGFNAFVVHENFEGIPQQVLAPFFNCLRDNKEL